MMRDSGKGPQDSTHFKRTSNRVGRAQMVQSKGTTSTVTRSEREVRPIRVEKIAAGTRMSPNEQSYNVENRDTGVSPLSPGQGTPVEGVENDDGKQSYLCKLGVNPY